MQDSPLLIHTGKTVITLALADLLYITTDKQPEHFLCFVTTKARYYCKGTLQHWETTYGLPLFRCHRSTLVNLENIGQIDKQSKRIYFSPHSAVKYFCTYSRRQAKNLASNWKSFVV